MAGSMEDGRSGVPCVSHPEHRDIDPIWKKTDEGAGDRPFHVSGKGGLGVYEAVSLTSEEPSDDELLYGPGPVRGGRGIGLPGHKARLGNRPERFDPFGQGFSMTDVPPSTKSL